MENVKKQGFAPFNAAPGTYQVFRNVLDFGAKGDGIHDDTAAIQSAIAAGARCAPGTCSSSTTSPAIVYFPPGTYLVSSPISIYYMTQMIGNPNCLPTIKASSSWPVNPYGRNFVFDADAYQSTGNLAYGATNVSNYQNPSVILLVSFYSSCMCFGSSRLTPFSSSAVRLEGHEETITDGRTIRYSGVKFATL